MHVQPHLWEFWPNFFTMCTFILNLDIGKNGYLRRHVLWHCGVIRVPVRNGRMKVMCVIPCVYPHCNIHLVIWQPCWMYTSYLQTRSTDSLSVCQSGESAICANENWNMFSQYTCCYADWLWLEQDGSFHHVNYKNWRLPVSCGLLVLCALFCLFCRARLQQNWLLLYGYL